MHLVKTETKSFVQDKFIKHYLHSYCQCKQAIQSTKEIISNLSHVGPKHNDTLEISPHNSLPTSTITLREEIKRNCFLDIL
jgi:hypothetical protein